MKFDNIEFTSTYNQSVSNRKEWAREERARGRKKDGGGGSMEAGDLFHSMIRQCH